MTLSEPGVMDLVLLAVIVLSAVLGLFRGFIETVVSNVAWLLAGWAAFRFGNSAGQWLASGAEPSATQAVAGYVLVFLLVLVAVVLIGKAIHAAVDAVSLGGLDRMLGLLLGGIRGVVIACVLVLLAGFTPLTAQPAWKQSRLLPVLLPGADWMRAHLPHWSVPAVDLGKLPLNGDNAALIAVPETALPLNIESMAQPVDNNAAAPEASVEQQ